MPRHPVISWGAAARQLGVNKSSLWRVANGKRRGPELLARYQKLLLSLAPNDTIAPPAGGQPSAK